MKAKEYYYLENNQSAGPLNLAELLEIIDRESLVWYDGIEWTIAYELDELKKFFSTREKIEPKVMYYYSFEGEQFGPFDLNQFLTKIDSNTLVWREGIEWTEAKNLVELKKLFSKINTNFSEEKHSIEYYYLENNESVGPLNLFELLEIIDRGTMVWRQGIDWSIACNIEELQKYFPVRIEKSILTNITPVNKPTFVNTQDKLDIQLPLSISASNVNSEIKSDNRLSEILESLLIEKSNNFHDQQNTITLTLKKLYEDLKKVTRLTESKFFISPNINIKKLNNLKNKIGNITGIDSDCLIYSDNTAFGAGDEGFIVTKNIIAWHYGSKNPMSITWKEIEFFKIGKNKYDLILKSLSGIEYTIKITMIPFPQILADAFNELLRVFNSALTD